MWFTNYDEETGRILGNMQGDRNLAEANKPYVEGRFSADTHHIVDGVAVHKDPAEIEAKEIEQAWFELRRMRDALLQDSDWTQVPDAPVDTQAWADYRQQLRNLPSNTTDPRAVVWPEKPNS